MNKNLHRILMGTEKSLMNPNKSLEWKNRDDKDKYIIFLALLDLELYHIDMEISSKIIWDKLNKLFGWWVVNINLSLKLQLFSFKM